MFGTIHAQQQNGGCCTTTADHPMPVVTPESCEMMNTGDDDDMLYHSTAVVKEYNYFDYDANADTPLSPLGVSPERELENGIMSTSRRSSNLSRKGSGGTTTNASPNNNWKTRVISIWSSVSKHTCRCFGESFSNDNDQGQVGGGGGGGGCSSGSKWKVSSATTAATSTTAANTSAAAAAAAGKGRKMNQTPMFSTPVKSFD